MKSLISIVLLLTLPATALGQAASIVNSKHNLSAAGPGAVRAAAEQQICIFCHTPHNAAPIQPLWNRNVPVSAYTVYSSSSLDAAPAQPTGSSKLCLSCHDGTIALGNVLSRSQPIGMAGGLTTIPPGSAHIGTDLSDDHPISFRYDVALATLDPKLRLPTQLPPAIKLDPRQEMQCTTCHDAHDDTFGKFLVMDNVSSQLCKSCHQQGETDILHHVNCNSCHTPHTSPSGPHLLKSATVTDACLTCHSGLAGPMQGENIAADLSKLSPHDTRSPVNLENHIPNNVVCKDCHEPHTARSQTASAPAISPKLGNIDGRNAAGAAVPRAQFEYEVCFKCHADLAATQPYISRQIVQNNTRLEFAPSAVSFHPVQAAGKNSDVPSLSPGLTEASLIYCTDCHASDTGESAGGSGPSGPHGSNHRPLLIARYDTTDDTSESATAYALCYRCHDRSSILSDRSFPTHRLHIVDSRTPCSVCHDAHGISSTQGTAMNSSHLINFDTTVVQPDPVTNRLEFNDLGNQSGRCFLSCHGTAHSPLSY